MKKELFLKQELRVEDAPGHSKLPMMQNTEKVESIGRMLMEANVELAKNGSWMSRSHKKKSEDFFKNSIGMEMPNAEDFEAMSQEDLTFPNNTALYTTVVRNIVERAFRPQLVMNEVIKTITVNAQGMKDLQVPISALRTALALPSTGVLAAPTNDDYSDATIDLTWIYSYEVITIQLIQQGIIDIVQDQMFELGDALARKVDLDIVTAIETASPLAGTNNNYVALGVATFMTYSALVDGVMAHIALNALPDAIVTNPLTWANFLKDSNVITALGYNSQDKGSLFPRIQDFLGLRVILTTQATAKNLYLVDSARCKYLVEGSAIQMLDGRQSGTVNTEIIGLKLYGVQVVQPEAVYRIVEDTA